MFRSASSFRSIRKSRSCSSAGAISFRASISRTFFPQVPPVGSASRTAGRPADRAWSVQEVALRRFARAVDPLEHDEKRTRSSFRATRRARRFPETVHDGDPEALLGHRLRDDDADVHAVKAVEGGKEVGGRFLEIAAGREYLRPAGRDGEARVPCTGGSLRPPRLKSIAAIPSASLTGMDGE